MACPNSLSTLKIVLVKKKVIYLCESDRQIIAYHMIIMDNDMIKGVVIELLYHTRLFKTSFVCGFPYYILALIQ